MSSPSSLSNVNDKDFSPTAYRYKYTYKWVDGIVGYLQYPPPMSDYLCTWLKLESATAVTGDKATIRTVDCYNAVREVDDYVCEQSEGETHQPNALTAVINHALSYDRRRYVTCPAGHITHQFMSCDPLSLCWARDQQSVPSCQTSLNPRPPMFTCTGETEHVPYSLVCDHRVDCRDHSDEDFCTYPESLCHGASFHCGNMQVDKPSFLPVSVTLAVCRGPTSIHTLYMFLPCTVNVHATVDNVAFYTFTENYQLCYINTQAKLCVFLTKELRESCIRLKTP